MLCCSITNKKVFSKRDGKAKSFDCKADQVTRWGKQSQSIALCRLHPTGVGGFCVLSALMQAGKKCPSLWGLWIKDLFKLLGQDAASSAKTQSQELALQLSTKA